MTRILVSPGITIDTADGMPLIRGSRPETWPQLADALYLVASTIDRNEHGNALRGLGEALATALLDRLDNAIAGHSFDDINTALDSDQRAQLRASVGTILCELTDAAIQAAIGNDAPAAVRLLGRAVHTIERLAGDESNPGVRDTLVFGLYRLQTRLPRQLARVSRTMMRELQQLTPPYDAWLADGKVSIDFIISPQASLVDTMRTLERAGFEPVGSAPTPILRATVGPAEQPVEVEIRLHVAQQGIPSRVVGDRADILWLADQRGDARALAQRLDDGQEIGGQGMLVIVDTAVGRDTMARLRHSLPNAQLAGTLGGPDSAGAEAMMRALLRGIAGRRSWAGIRRDLGDLDVGGVMTPADVLLRRRLLDRDGDGRADTLDRLFDVNLTSIDESLQRAFEPIAAEEIPHALQGVKASLAAGWLEQTAGAGNEALAQVLDGARIESTGFFRGAPGDPPVRVVPSERQDGAPGWQLSVNHRFAHMPEDALRVVALFELNRVVAERQADYAFHDDPKKARLNGLFAVAQLLDGDDAKRADALWQSFLRAYELPASIDRGLLRQLREEHPGQTSTTPGGSIAAVEAAIVHFADNMPDALAGLDALNAGAWPSPTSPKRAGLPQALMTIDAVRVTHGTDPGDYYCEHAFFVGQRQAAKDGSSVLRNQQGEALVGFLHVPGDNYSGINNLSARHYQQSQRFADLRQVLGAALAGYIGRESMPRVDRGPIRLMLTGFGEFGGVKNNPSQDFVSHRENIDAAMQAAFGDDLLTPDNELGADGGQPPMTLLYTIRDPATGRQRDVRILAAVLPVNDNALSPEQAGSIPTMMQSFRPHAVISMGVSARLQRTYNVEHHADSGGLRLGRPPTHEWLAPADVTLQDNWSLARAIHAPG